jgi:hypothetical protein
LDYLACHWPPARKNIACTQDREHPFAPPRLFPGTQRADTRLGLNTKDGLWEHTMTTSPRDTSLRTYQLLLYRSPVHPEFFQIGGRINMETGTYEVEAWVHPGGHTVRFEFEGATITEVVVPDTHTLPERGVLTTIPCVGEKDFDEVYADRISYVTSIQTETLSDHLYMSSYQEMLEHGQQQSDCLMMPGIKEGRLPSLSVIELQRYADQVHMQSYHFLGDTGLVLRTQSIMQAGTHPME